MLELLKDEETSATAHRTLPSRSSPGWACVRSWISLPNRASCRLIQSDCMPANGRGKAAPPLPRPALACSSRRHIHVPEQFANRSHRRGCLRHAATDAIDRTNEYVCRMRRMSRCALSMRALPPCPRCEATPRRGRGSRRLAQSNVVRSSGRAGHAVHRQPGRESDVAVISKYARVPAQLSWVRCSAHGRRSSRPRLWPVRRPASDRGHPQRFERGADRTVPVWRLSIPDRTRVTDLLTGSVHEVEFGAHYGAILVQ